MEGDLESHRASDGSLREEAYRKAVGIYWDTVTEVTLNTMQPGTRL